MFLSSGNPSPTIVLGFLTLSKDPCPNLPYSPSPQLKTSPDDAKAKLCPFPPFDEESWVIIKPFNEAIGINES